MQKQNKTAIVTGASKGIGKGIALEMAKEGYNIVVSDIDSVEANKVVKEIKALGSEAVFIKCDVSRQADVSNLFKTTVKNFKTVDVLVNNAGIFPFVAFDKMKESEWDKVMNINLKGIFYTSKEAVKVMKQGGRIINISSIASFVGFQGLTHYCASKGAVNSMVRALALELAPLGITVNAVAPGAIDTPGASSPDQPRTSAEAVKKQTAAMIPLKRMGLPEDIAHAVVFLASQGAGYVTGQTIIVDGGWTIQ